MAKVEGLHLLVKFGILGAGSLKLFVLCGVWEHEFYICSIAACCFWAGFWCFLGR
jgi:hypothetical protein